MFVKSAFIKWFNSLIFVRNNLTVLFSRYAFILEAPTSIIQRRGDDTLTYLNKGLCTAVGHVYLLFMYFT